MPRGLRDVTLSFLPPSRNLNGIFVVSLLWQRHRVKCQLCVVTSTNASFWCSRQHEMNFGLWTLAQALYIRRTFESMPSTTSNSVHFTSITLKAVAVSHKRDTKQKHHFRRFCTQKTINEFPVLPLLLYYFSFASFHSSIFNTLNHTHTCTGKNRFLSNVPFITRPPNNHKIFSRFSN